MEDVPPPTQKYECRPCEYATSKKSSWQKHLRTKKHVDRRNRMPEPEPDYSCCCGKKYVHHQSYYRHIKDCSKHKKVKEARLVPRQPQQDPRLTSLLSRLQANLEKSNHYIQLLLDSMEEKHSMSLQTK